MQRCTERERGQVNGMEVAGLGWRAGGQANRPAQASAGYCTRALRRKHVLLACHQLQNVRGLPCGTTNPQQHCTLQRIPWRRAPSELHSLAAGWQRWVAARNRRRHVAAVAGRRSRLIERGRLKVRDALVGCWGFVQEPRQSRRGARAGAWSVRGVQADQMPAHDCYTYTFHPWAILCNPLPCMPHQSRCRRGAPVKLAGDARLRGALLAAPLDGPESHRRQRRRTQHGCKEAGWCTAG